MFRLPLICVALLLSACQGIPVERDFDPTRDFAGYRTWSWDTPRIQYRPDDPRLKSDLTEDRIANAVAEQLDQRGLRPAPAGQQGDVSVQVSMVVEQRQEQVSSGFSPMWGNPWHGYWATPMAMDTRTIVYDVQTLQVDLRDKRDGKLVWRASADQIRRNQANPNERTQAIRETVARILSQYPPR